MSQVELFLLGGIRAETGNGEEITLPTRKARLLLAYLALSNGRAYSRDKLTGLFWGDRGEEQARGSLRNALTSLRKAVGPDVVIADPDTVALAPAAISLDVERFEELATVGTAESLSKAATTFKGDFLENVNVDEPDLQDWLQFERARFSEIAQGVLRGLLRIQRDSRDLKDAAQTAIRLIEIDPLQEDVHRELIKIYAADGQRGLALHQYAACRRLLADELGLEPDENTESLVKEIRRQGPSSPLTDSDDKHPSTEVSKITATSVERPVPIRPSVAVMPFENLSGESDQDYIADGVVEEITAALSRVRNFFIISSSSTLVYKDRPTDTKQVSQELGVRYLLRGSVRKSGDRLRITTRMIDAVQDEQMWTERYDGEMDELFDLQDRITEGVVGKLQPTILDAEIRRVARKRPENLDAYDYVMKALPKAWSCTKVGNAEALGLLAEALALDPEYPMVYALTSWCYAQHIVYNWMAVTEEHKNESLAMARKAAELDADDPLVLTMLATAETLAGDLDAAGLHIERALAFDRNSAWAWCRSGWILTFKSEEPETAIRHFQHAIRLSPLNPMNFNLHFGLGMANFVAGNYEQSAGYLEKGLLEKPEAVWANRPLAANYALLGRDAEARRVTALILEYFPGLTAKAILDALPYRKQEVIERYQGALVAAGLPAK